MILAPYTTSMYRKGAICVVVEVLSVLDRLLAAQQRLARLSSGLLITASTSALYELKRLVLESTCKTAIIFASTMVIIIARRWPRLTRASRPRRRPRGSVGSRVVAEELPRFGRLRGFGEGSTEGRRACDREILLRLMFGTIWMRNSMHARAARPLARTGRPARLRGALIHNHTEHTLNTTNNLRLA